MFYSKGKRKYFPGHQMENLVCQLCYCPIFPCQIEKTGGKWHKGIWDCSDCTIIHQDDVTYIIDAFVRNLITLKANEKK